MTNRAEYKEALSAVDRNTRLCLLYLEKKVDDKFKADLEEKLRRPDSKPDLSKIEVRLDSLQKQIDGFRVKVEESYNFTKDHDEQEKYLIKLADNAEKMITGARKHFEELYQSGYYKEGTRRKIREEGLIE